MTAGLTPRQAECLAFIRRFIADSGFAPSYREIGAALGVSGAGVVQALVDALVERGHLRRVRWRKRALEVVEHAPLPDDLCDMPLTDLEALQKRVEAALFLKRRDRALRVHVGADGQVVRP